MSARPLARLGHPCLRAWPEGLSLALALPCTLVFALALTPPLAATGSEPPVNPGIDVWTTPGGGVTFQDFSGNPIPADFFDPGSDPFTGSIDLQGLPLPDLTPPPAVTGVPVGQLPFDTVVQRLEPAPLPKDGTQATIPIEIVALQLQSIQPITVTYNGGNNPELWDVRVCLSSTLPQLTGSMTLHRTCPQGGTFDSSLGVIPKLIFLRQSDGALRQLDPGPEVFLTANRQRWVHNPDPSLQVFSVPPGVVTDGNCDGIPDSALPGTSNFAPGVWELTCESKCVIPPPGTSTQRKRLTKEEEMLAAHGVTIAQEPPPDGDGDGHGDDADNCPNTPNPLQEDVDNDSVGDLCDNCLTRFNPCQEDDDNNGIGNECEPFIFADGFESGDVSAWSAVVP